MLRFLKRFAAIRKKRRQNKREAAAIEKAEKKQTSYTKFVIACILAVAIIWVTWSYALASLALYMYGNTDPLASLSERVCETIIAAILGYFLKSAVENVSQYGYKGKVTETETCTDEDAAG